MSVTFKVLIESYGKWGAIGLVIIPSVFVWYVAHSNSQECERVEVFWGMVNYTKEGACDAFENPNLEDDEIDIDYGIDNEIRNGSLKSGDIPACTGKIIARNRGVSTVSIHVSARRESETFKYDLSGSNRINLLDVDYFGGRWFKVSITGNPQNKIGWIHENNLAELKNCYEMVK